MRRWRARVRYQHGGAVVLVDLDHFKLVNDRHGHQAGDRLLQAVAAAMLNRLRKTDFLARVGGDEFALIFDRVDSDADPLELATKLIERVTQTGVALYPDCDLGASAGVALFDSHGPSASVLLQRADAAMYAAKAAGRGRAHAASGLKRARTPDILSSMPLPPRARQVALAPEQHGQSERNDGHEAHRHPDAAVPVNQRQGVKVHAENAGDQVQGQKDGGQHGQRAHDLVGAVALRVEVHLHGGFGALLQPPHVVHHPLNVLQHVAAAHLQQVALALALGRGRLRARS